jgi:hypothetical protein
VGIYILKSHLVHSEQIGSLMCSKGNHVEKEDREWTHTLSCILASRLGAGENDFQE